MTLSDLDLEARLRDLGARADEIAPAPVDLADRVRNRHRVLRRREIGLVAAGLAAVLVLVVGPVVASTVAARPDRTHRRLRRRPGPCPHWPNCPPAVRWRGTPDGYAA